ncbi:VOC family protein [Stieleria sp. JC731]|uniref:VOC family protein n=1 Tax=Pirellulaceae TaxID=2691357 RepID=UPI001E415B4A|nr:VOC family protein [Stieleria sp. JC731]MCC9602855.1 VOC family protein [Stieleria sp. JC731]
MTSPQLNLLVIRSTEPVRTVSFYEMLGLRFQEEQHGSGPIHWAAELDALVMEVYPAQAPDEVDRTTRIGFSVDDIESILATMRDQNVEILNDLKQTRWGLRTVVKDPDGRSVEMTKATELHLE